MKRLLLLLLGTFLCLAASSQTRTYADNESGTFIFGLDSYFYGRSGSLEFKVGNRNYQVTVDNGDVYIDNSALEGGRGEVAVGIHDFTGDRVPELVVARRNNRLVAVSLYILQNGGWIPLGSIDPVEGSEIRVFRQVISVRNGDVLHSWTWRDNGFDYKSNR